MPLSLGDPVLSTMNPSCVLCVCVGGGVLVGRERERGRFPGEGVPGGSRVSSQWARTGSPRREKDPPHPPLGLDPFIRLCPSR